jgi:hypothetical protein
VTRSRISHGGEDTTPMTNRNSDREGASVAALFVDERPGGAYVGLPYVDVWGISRDARKYPGPHPVVAHPPCARWCRLAGLVEARWGHKRGEDDGCFAAALASVRKWGGVLEHPAYSDAWSAFDLPMPALYGWQRGICGGWATHVEQGHFGHLARKATRLYGFGVELPTLPWGPGPTARAWVSWCGNHNRTRTGQVQRLSSKQRSASPLEFRDLLISIARSARKQEQAA